MGTLEMNIKGEGNTQEIDNCNATATSEKRHRFQTGNWFPD
jgi:hypothetical protein